MLPIVSMESGKALFNAMMSQTWAMEQGEVTGGNCTLVWGEGQYGLYGLGRRGNGGLGRLTYRRILHGALGISS